MTEKYTVLGRVRSHTVGRYGYVDVTIDVGEFTTVGERAVRGTLYVEELSAAESAKWQLGKIVEITVALQEAPAS